MRRFLMALLVMLAGALIVVDAFVPGLGLGPARDVLVEGTIILGSFALLAGVLNLLRWHLRHIRQGEGSRGQSSLLVLALLIVAAIVITLPSTTAPAWIYVYLYSPVQASLMALLAFYSITAALRTFSLRTPDAILLMISAVLVLLLQLPLAQAAWAPLSAVRDWLLMGPVAGIVRGVLIGAALGAITAALRTLLGQNRPQVGE